MHSELNEIIKNVFSSTNPQVFGPEDLFHLFQYNEIFHTAHSLERTYTPLLLSNSQIRFLVRLKSFNVKKLTFVFSLEFVFFKRSFVLNFN